jgi:uncharacterized protein (UPF0335 family)
MRQPNAEKAEPGDCGNGLPGNDLLGGEINQRDSENQAPGQAANGQLRSHFDRAVELLEQKLELATTVAEWRKEARNDGLDPVVLLRLAKESLRDAEQRRKAAERAEIEELYRNGLGLPLFDYAEGRAA